MAPSLPAGELPDLCLSMLMEKEVPGKLPGAAPVENCTGSKMFQLGSHSLWPHKVTHLFTDEHLICQSYGFQYDFPDGWAAPKCPCAGLKFIIGLKMTAGAINGGWTGVLVRDRSRLPDASYIKWGKDYKRQLITRATGCCH